MRKHISHTGVAEVADILLVGGIVMPGDDGATPLQESMKQDYQHISKHTRFI